ncbi:MAG: class I SAM-dependent methyltransferase [Deltaproteobacteria bacterium]|nr:class I SAM-dependent methyltransferase [Deltaproteobacteria bacterium]MBN2686673.1 class I SAM-dependent methyltransferase [Deltaproteobacteria bacterium]
MEYMRTYGYHKYQPIDLMTELTVCESLARTSSLSMAALERRKPYGAIIGEMLTACGLLYQGCTVCEIGGGYGSLMKGLLEEYAPLIRRVVMVDLSPRLLRLQRKALERWKRKVTFIQADVMELMPVLSNIDVVIINEMIGDLDTWKDLAPSQLPDDAAALVLRYSLEIPPEGRFHFNVGAVRLVESICRTGVAAFISEHSSDPVIPHGMEYLRRGLSTDGFPREILLKGHAEFTIRFSHLESVARFWGKSCFGGALADLVGVRKSPKMRFIFTARACATDEQAILLEFLDHIREYRWLVIR